MQREALDKPTSLKVFVGVERDHDHLVITVADDGEGIDGVDIVEKAINKNLISTTQADQLNQGEGVRLILLEGFSDRKKSKQSRESCANLYDIQQRAQVNNGELSLRNRPGVFCEFTLIVPD